MSLPIKLAAFDQVVYQLTQWYSEQNESWEINNDLSRLKITKLLFFVTAATTSYAEPGLLGIFNSFAALPYGHVESQIQDHMNLSVTYDITIERALFKQGINRYETAEILDPNVIDLISSGITVLKEKNVNLINYGAFDLVELSHRWQSWRTVFSLAKRNGKFSMGIPSEMIMSEPKIFK